MHIRSELRTFVRGSGLALGCLVAGLGCSRAQVDSGPALGLSKVVIYRNGVGYFERSGHLARSEVTFRVLHRDVNDFLATLVVMERGGSSVRAAAFPMPADGPDGAAPRPDARRTVSLALDGAEHDLVVGYAVETPIWRPSYRLVFSHGAQPRVQAWGIVQNLSGEDWRGVRLSLVTGAPVSFRSELARATVPTRPLVSDEGAVIQAVPTSETTLAIADAPAREEAQRATRDQVANRGLLAALEAPAAAAADESFRQSNASGDLLGDAFGAGGLGAVGAGRGRDHAFRRARYAAATAAPAAVAAPPLSTAPRNVAALAGLATQAGSTRYDLPNPVTIPDRSATMVMLSSREAPGEKMYLFAPDPGVPDSASHPFHVARFVNRSGAVLERGPIAIFEEGAFLGQGMLDALPDGATATVPFSLDRGLAVSRASATAVEGARLVSMHRGALTIERFNVRRSTFHVRNGTDAAARVMVREALDGAELFEPPTGTETSNGNALAPCAVPAHGEADVRVVSRAPFTLGVDLADEQGGLAVEQYLREGHPAADVATALRAALELRRTHDALSRERADVEQRRNDLEQGAEETRQNLSVIMRNPQAADLRAQLTARLGRTATEVDRLTRRVVELDVELAERRVRLAEAVRTLEVDAPRRP